MIRAVATNWSDGSIRARPDGERELNRTRVGKLARYFHVAPGAFAFAD